MERNKKIAIAVTAAVLVLTIVVYLLLNNPDDMKISGLNTGDGRTRQAQDAGDGRYENNMTVQDKLDITFHKEFGEKLDVESTFKEMDVFSGKVIKQPVEQIIEDEQIEEQLEEYDEDGNLIEREYTDDDEENKDVEEINEYNNEFNDPLLEKSSEEVLYKIQKYIGGEIINNGYLSVLTKKYSDSQTVSYKITINSAKRSASYIDYYDRVIKYTNAENERILLIWSDLYTEVVKYRDIINKIADSNDLPAYIDDLNKLKLVEKADKFIEEAVKYIGDYDPLAEITDGEDSITDEEEITNIENDLNNGDYSNQNDDINITEEVNTNASE